MVTYQNGQIIIDGKPVLLLCGEIHYYRLTPDQWEDRLDKLQQCGMNAVATYVPWVLHEMAEGHIDMHGKTEPRLNLDAFVQLCQSRGLYVFLRPGPFIMAEMKNDGIPFWVYEKYPDALPISFDGVGPTTPTLDYSHEGFLSSVKNWYKACMGLAAKYMYPGGKVIMVQLDNEVGMLSWVSNRPDLNDGILKGFAKFLGVEPTEAFFTECRSPQNCDGVTRQRAFMRYSRTRYAEYIKTLREYAREYGVTHIPFVVNIHGCSNGRGYTYPIGVSQLLEAINCESDVISGSDVYFDEMKVPNFADMYLCNEITKAANLGGRPLTCVEFSCGDSNFGDDLSNRNLASGSDFRTRLFVAQGNRLINYYLFCGGQNWEYPFPQNDGNNRIATTGENHGFAAPIGPTGLPNQGFARMARVTNQMTALGDKLAVTEPDYDDFAYGFIVDDFMTEYKYDKSPETAEMFDELRNRRAGNVWDSAMRAALLMGAVPKVEMLRANAPKASFAIVPSSKYMSAQLQESLVRYIQDGGSLLLQGRVPQFNEDGQPCLILAEALEADGFIENVWRQRYDPAVVSCGFLTGLPEYFSWNYETMNVKNAEPILREFSTGRIMGFYKEIGKGRVVVLSCECKCRIAQYSRIFDKLGAQFGLSHDIDVNGVGVCSLMTKTHNGERFLHLFNLDDVPKEFNVYFNGENIVEDRKIRLPENDALMLPIGVDMGFAKILYSTLEMTRVGEKFIAFRNTEKFSKIAVASPLTPVGEYISVSKKDGYYILTTDNRLCDDEVIIRFAYMVTNEHMIKE